jgi:hypothetical protein
MPSHQTPPSGVSATLVKIVFREIVAIALGFVFADVPGATPKKPASGLRWDRHLWRHRYRGACTGSSLGHESIVRLVEAPSFTIQIAWTNPMVSLFVRLTALLWQ